MLQTEIIKDIRRGIIYMLSVQEDGTLNESVLLRGIRSGGHELTRSVMRTHLRYLAAEDKGYVRLEYLGDADMYVATITGKGRDVNDDIIIDPGINKVDH